MVRSGAHPNQWAMGLILPPTKRGALECLSKVDPPTSKFGGVRPTPTSPRLSLRIMAAPVEPHVVRGKSSTNRL